MSRMLTGDSYGQWEGLANQRDQMASQNFFQALQARQRDAAMAEEIQSRNQSRLLQALLAARDQANTNRAFDFNVAVNKSKLDLDRQELADRLSQNLWTRDYQDRSLAQRDKPSPREFADIQTAIANGEMAPEDAKAFGFTPEQVAALRRTGEFARENKRREHNAATAFAADLNRNEELKARKEKAMTDLAAAWFWQRKEPNRTLSETSGSLKSSDDWLKEVRRRDPSLDSLVTKDESSGKWIVDMPNPRPKAPSVLPAGQGLQSPKVASTSTDTTRTSTAGATRNWLQEAAVTNSPASKPQMNREEARQAYTRLRDFGLSHEQAKAAILGSGSTSGVNAPIPLKRSDLNPQQRLYLDLRKQGASHESALAAAKAAPAASDPRSKFKELVRSGMPLEEAFESATAGSWR